MVLLSCPQVVKSKSTSDRKSDDALTNLVFHATSLDTPRVNANTEAKRLYKVFLFLVVSSASLIALTSMSMNKAKVYAQVAARYTEDLYPHLDEMNITELCNRRLELYRKLKSMEEEKKAIDEQLLNYLSEAELKRGIKATDGSLLKIRNRSSWEYPEDVVRAIKDIREEAQHLGTATKLSTTYLTFTTF